MGKKNKSLERIESQPEELLAAISEESIPKHRQCPQCWGTRRGVGCAYDSRKPYDSGQDDWAPNVRRRYYRCTRTLNPDEHGPCGHTWVVTIEATETVKVMSRPLEIQVR